MDEYPELNSLTCKMCQTSLPMNTDDILSHSLACPQNSKVLPTATSAQRAADMKSRMNKRKMDEMKIHRAKDSALSQPQTSSAQEKPRFSYSQLIAQGICLSPHREQTLYEIYSFISQHYPYYKQSEANWKKSVRDNLSLRNQFLNYDGHWRLEPGKEMKWFCHAFSESNHREVVGWGLEGLGEVETPWLRDDDEGGEKRQTRPGQTTAVTRRHTSPVRRFCYDCRICNLPLECFDELKSHVSGCSRFVKKIEESARKVREYRPVVMPPAVVKAPVELRPDVPCIRCKRSFPNEEAYQLHVDFRHTFTCSHCGQVFAERILLKRHVKNVHKRLASDSTDTPSDSNLERYSQEIQMQFMCDTCQPPVVFGSANSYDCHFSSSHRCPEEECRHLLFQCQATLHDHFCLCHPETTFVVADAPLIDDLRASSFDSLVPDEVVQLVLPGEGNLMDEVAAGDADADGCSRMITDASGCSRMIKDASGCSRTFADARGCSRTFAGAACSPMLTDGREFVVTRILPGVDGSSRLITDEDEAATGFDSMRIFCPVLESFPYSENLPPYFEIAGTTKTTKISNGPQFGQFTKMDTGPKFGQITNTGNEQKLDQIYELSSDDGAADVQMRVGASASGTFTVTLLDA